MKQHHNRRHFVGSLAEGVAGAIAPQSIRSTGAPGLDPDLVVFNANVYTVDSRNPQAEALAVKGDRFVAVGYTTEALLRNVGLRRSDLEEPDGRVLCAAVVAILGMALQERPLKNLGCRIAAETPIGAFPVIDYLIVTSENVGEGLRHLAHYFGLCLGW